jgi:hypothetical protein
VVFISSAESQQDALASASNSDAVSQRLVDRMREDVMRKLAERFVDQCRQKAGLARAAAGGSAY